MIYVIILLLLVVLSSYFDFKNFGVNSKTRSWFWFVCLLLILFAGLRYMRGGDTINYYSYFRNAPTLSEISWSFFEKSRYQYGFNFFIILCKTISSSFSFVQFVTAIILNVSLFHFIQKKSLYPFYCIVLYYILNYLEFNMEIMRESLAVAMGLWFWLCWEKKKYFFSLLFVFLAYSMHVSALVLLLFPFISKIHFTQISFALVTLSIPLIPFIYMRVPNIEYYVLTVFNPTDGMLEAYTKQSFNEHLNAFFYIQHVFIWFVIPGSALLYLCLKKREKFTGFVYLFIVLHLLGGISYAFYRFANYLAPFYWIVLSESTISFVREDKILSKQIHLSLFLVVIMMVFFFQRQQLLYDSVHKHYLYERYVPYQIGFYE